MAVYACSVTSTTKAGTKGGTRHCTRSQDSWMPLSDRRIRNSKPKRRRSRLSDAHGLALEVSPAGGRYWRYRYRLDGTENIFAAGEWCSAPYGETIEQAEKRRASGRLTLAEARIERVKW